MSQPKPTRGATRRALLGGLLGGLSLAAANPQGTIQSLGNQKRKGSNATKPGAQPLRAASPTWSLRAEPTPFTFPSGASMPFFRLVHVSGGSVLGNVPLLQATEGQQVVLEIENLLPVPVTPSVLGHFTGAQIPAGQTAQLTFTMPGAGSYLISHVETQQGSIGGLQMANTQRRINGFSAMLISRPTSGLSELWNGGPAFDREYFLLYEDEDDRWNAFMANMTARPPVTPYEPNY
ncbi:MAG: hypothetical protein KDB61_12845, partial [Planctomycetes bacterium]|nr:hypothetical protein [Planctomycetota bacterium]